jgi:hypothetical protein
MILSRGRGDDRLEMDGRRIFLLALAISGAASTVQGQPVPPRVVCVYDDRSFSNGAHICVQKNLMMTCTVTEQKPIWTLVLDEALSERCLVPFQDLNARWHHHVVRRQARVGVPQTPASAPCFTFNGKRYCE